MYLEHLSSADPKVMSFKQIIEVYNTNFELLKNFILTLGDKYVVEKFSGSTERELNLEHSYNPERNNLFVYINGVLQELDKDYTETGTNSIQLTSDRDYYDEIKVIIIQANLLQVSVEEYVEQLSNLVNNSKTAITLARSLLNEGTLMQENIKEYYDSIESTYNEMSKVAKELRELAEKSDSNLVTSQAILNQIIDLKTSIEALSLLTPEQIEGTEIVQARSGFAILGSRLDRMLYQFDTVQDMRTCMALKEGDRCLTFGKDAIGDDSTKVYKVSSIENLPEGADEVYELGNGLRVYLLTIFSGIGGGGGGVGGSVTLTPQSELTQSVATGASAYLTYLFETTLGTAGTAKYYVDDILKYTQSISNGSINFDIGPYLKEGSNAVDVVVTDRYGGQGVLSYLINTVSLSISSTFDGDVAYSGDIEYLYTPVGAAEKTVHFLIDGMELYSAKVTASGRQQTQLIPALSHGAHLFEVYMTAEFSGTKLESNRLSYSLITYEEGNSAAIIASSFNTQNAIRGTVLNIDYLVYTPGAVQSAVTLLVNDDVVSSLTVGRTRQYWNVADYPSGNVKFTIKTGEYSKTFTVKVTEPEIDLSAETAGLELYLTSMGRSNSENDKQEWSYQSVNAELTNFNFSNNGWIINEDGDTVLRLTGDARVVIPYQLFATDPRTNGMTIEFEFATRNVADFEAVLVECMNKDMGIQITGNKAILASEKKKGESAITTQFKEEEKIRVSFVIQSRSQNRLLYTYINGALSGLAQYDSDDNFVQSTPAFITIGSNRAGIDLYNIRKYKTALTTEQILRNYIADMPSMSQKLAQYERNDIFDDYSNISYSKVSKVMPCLTITGPLPAVKGDKQKVSASYRHPQDDSKNFDFEGVTIDIQGTSSQYYPRKNYKLKFPEEYQLRTGCIPEKEFTYKADYMESGHRHNTVTAQITNDLYKVVGLLPPQASDSKVRMSIDGYICAIFYRESEDIDRICMGIYNFNNDKGDVDTFGYTAKYPAAESWEFKNNTADRCLFREFWSPYYKLAGDAGYIRVKQYDPEVHTLDSDTQYYLMYKENATDPDTYIEVSTYDANPGNYLIDVHNDFEARYPEAYEDNPVYTNLARVVSWVASTANDLDKFIAEVDQYFSLDHLVAYYVIGLTLGMADSFAKNLFISTWDGQKWYPIFYDMDTCYGLNNEGEIVFNYDVEFNDSLGTKSVFNGAASILWNNVQNGFASRIKDMFITLSNKGLNYDTIANLHIDHTADISEAMFNEDAEFKYEQPLTQDGIGTYLYVAQGPRLDHFKWWLSNRFNYLNSKFEAASYLKDYLTLRLYTPLDANGNVDSSLVVDPNADFTIETYASEYVEIKFGSKLVGKRVNKGESVLIEAPDGEKFNDTETIVYGASNISKLGDLSGKYAGTVDISNATRLTELVIGNATAGYENTNLDELYFGNNKLLELVDVRNCSALKGSLDMSGCENIQEIYAQGTKLTSILLPSGGNLKKIYLPDTITNLTIQNQKSLTNCSLAGYSNLTTLRVENTDGVPISDILAGASSISWVRLINVDITAPSFDVLEKLGACQGIDETGSIIPTPIVTGTYYSEAASTALLEEMRAKYKDIFPDLVIDAAHPVFYDVKFVDWDGTVLKTQSVEYGLNATPPATSSLHRAADDKCSAYTFNRWDGTYTNVTSARTIIARYTGTKRTFSVKFYNNGKLIESYSAYYGERINIDFENIEGFGYQGGEAGNWKFWKWDKSIAYVTQDMETNALWVNVDEENGFTDSEGNQIPYQTPFGDQSLSWKQIQEIGEAGLASFWWSVGDTKDVLLSTGETITFQIYGFDHDYTDSTRTTTHPITIGMKNLMASLQQMNSSNTNLGSWTECKMRKTLNDTIFNTLPLSLREIIKETTKWFNAGQLSQEIESASDKLFLFSYSEVNLNTTTEPYCYEGRPYSLFTNNTSRIKYRSNGTGSAYYWWLRSPDLYNLTYFCLVHSNGYAYNYFAANSIGVCFGFCL